MLSVTPPQGYQRSPALDASDASQGPAKGTSDEPANGTATGERSVEPSGGLSPRQSNGSRSSNSSGASGGADPSDVNTDSSEPRDSSDPSDLAGNFEDIDSLLANVSGDRSPTITPSEGFDAGPKNRRSKPKKVAGNKKPGNKTQEDKTPRVKPGVDAADAAERSRRARLQAPKGSADAEANLKLTSVTPRQSNRSTNPTTDDHAATAANAGVAIPDSQWQSDATQRKKRLLQRIALGIAGVVVAALLVWSLFAGGGSDSTVAVLPETGIQGVADGAASNQTDADPSGGDRVSDAVAGAVGGDGDQPNLNQDTIDPPTNPPDPIKTPGLDLAATLQPDVISDPSANQSLPPEIADSNPTRPETVRAGQSPVVPLLPSGNTEGPADGDVPTDRGDKDNPSAQSGGGDLTSPFIASTENSLGELSKILQGQGTSLQQIEDIAEIQKERSLIGTPKYFVQRSGREDVDVQRQLSAELTGWKLDNVPLIDAVKDIELLADVPITFSADVFSQARFNLNRPVSLKVEAVSFKEALELVLVEDGLAIEILADGVRIDLPPSDDVVTKTYPQAFCTTEASAKRLRELIVAVTGIKDWEDDERFDLTVTTDAVSVSHKNQQHRVVEALVEKLAAAAQYNNVAQAGAIKETLRPLALSAEGTLGLSPDMKSANPYRRTMRVGSLFRHIRKATDLNVVADWEHLSQSGWFPESPLPGGIDEPTNRRLLDQLGHAMELTTMVVAPNTVMMTTFEHAGRRRDVEVFSVGDVIDNKMKPAQLDRLLTETLGVDQLSPPNAIVIYFAECKCLVANAPQIIQRQLFLIVNEL